AANDTLVISAGGAAAMGSVTGIGKVNLLASTSLTLNSQPNLLVYGMATAINGSAFTGFVPGDVIDVTNLAAPVFTGITVTTTSTALTIYNGSTTSKVTFNGNYTNGSFQLVSNGKSGTNITFVQGAAYNYTLPPYAATIALGPGTLNNTVTTTA